MPDIINMTITTPPAVNQSITGFGIKGDKGDAGDPATNLVTSVAGKIGAVALDKADVGLSNADNTSDLSKPISTATQTALNAKANASDTVNLTGDQTIAGVKTFTSAPIAPSGTSIGGVLYLTGTGFPEGVVSASVGSIYIDTAVTNGASSWIKKTGTGNTGWKVVYGDTGWRHLPIAGGGYFRVRRLNETIHWRLNGGSGVVAGTPLLTVPAGFIVDVGDPWFRPGAPIYRHGILLGGHLYLTGAGGPSSAGASTFYLTSGSVDFVGAAWMNYTTNDAWPATLPGTAA